MIQNPNYKQLYEEKCAEFQEISEQFNELQQQSTLIMNDLQDQIKVHKKKINSQQMEIRQLRDQKKYMTSTIERELNNSQKQKNQFKDKFQTFQKKVIQLEIINQNLQNELRATEFTLSEYQQRTEQTMEELAILQSQLQETTSANQEQVTRLKQQLKQTEQEMFVMHHRKKKRSQAQPDDQNSLSGKENLNINQSPSRRRIQSTILLEKQQVDTNNLKDIARESIFKTTLLQIRKYMNDIDDRKKQIHTKLFT